MRNYIIISNLCILPDVLDTMFVNAVINLNVEYLVDEVTERLMYGTFVVDLIYDGIQIIVRVNVQGHPLNSTLKPGKYMKLVETFKLSLGYRPKLVYIHNLLIASRFIDGTINS